MSYTIEECPDAWYVMEPYDRFGMSSAAAVCPTRDAAEAARRLLSGECERAALRETWCAAVDEAVFASGKEAGYAAGKADGAAQERARIVAFAKTYVKSPIRADVLAEMIERGEAGE